MAIFGEDAQDHDNLARREAQRRFVPVRAVGRSCKRGPWGGRAGRSACSRDRQVAAVVEPAIALRSTWACSASGWGRSGGRARWSPGVRSSVRCGVAPAGRRWTKPSAFFQWIVRDAGAPNRRARLVGGAEEVLDYDPGLVVQGIAQRGRARLLLRQCQFGDSRDALHAPMLGLR